MATVEIMLIIMTAVYIIENKWNFKCYINTISAKLYGSGSNLPTTTPIDLFTIQSLRKLLSSPAQLFFSSSSANPSYSNFSPAHLLTVPTSQSHCSISSTLFHKPTHLHLAFALSTTLKFRPHNAPPIQLPLCHISKAQLFETIYHQPTFHLATSRPAHVFARPPLLQHISIPALCSTFLHSRPLLVI